MAYASCVGVLVGIAIATVARPMLRADRRPFVKIAATLVVAYGSYGAASFVGASGILASAAAGIALPALARNEQLTIERFWDHTAAFANAVVFLLTGLTLQFARTFNEPLLLGVTLAAVLASRGFLAYVLVPLREVSTERRAWRHAIGLAGLRRVVARARSRPARRFPEPRSNHRCGLRGRLLDARRAALGTRAADPPPAFSTRGKLGVSR